MTDTATPAPAYTNGASAAAPVEVRSAPVLVAATTARVEPEHAEDFTRPVAAREINLAVIVCGGPGVGKTTVLRERVIEFLTRYPTGIAIVHDVQRQFADCCGVYERPGDARRLMQSQPRFQRGISITEWDAWPEIVDFAMELGKRHNEADAVRVPILVASDETSAIGSSGSTFVGANDLRLATQRRHFGIALLMNAQRPSQVTQAFWDLATEAVLFRQTSEDSARDLEKKLGLTKGTLQGLVNAEPRRYVRWRAGEGLV